MTTLPQFEKSLKRFFITANNVRTAVFVPQKFLRDLPKDLDNFAEYLPIKRRVVLLIHGINGSHYGLNDVARMLFDEGFLPILVDLPGHGDSGFLRNITLKDLRAWLTDVYAYVRDRYGRVSKLVAHSFGCYAVNTKAIFASFSGYDKHSRDNPEITFICPVPTPMRAAEAFADVAPRILRFRVVSKIYNYVPFSLWRGLKMLHHQSIANRERVLYSAKNDAKTTGEQRRFQAQLARGAIVKDIFARQKPDKVIAGEFDFVPREKAAEMQKVFPSAKLIILPTGHMPNVELPREVCDAIMRE